MNVQAPLSPTDISSVNAIAIVLADLQRAGVTDVMGSTPFNWFSAPPKPQAKPKQAQPKTPLAQLTAPKTTPKQKVITVEPVARIPTLTAETHVWTHTVERPTAHILTGGLPAQFGQLPFTDEEQILLQSMLASIALSLTTTATKALRVTDDTQLPYPIEALLPLQKACKNTASSSQKYPLVIFGQVAARVFTGQAEATLTDLREAAQAGQYDAEHPTIITYHPRTLLKQPALKQLVWHDFCSYLSRKES